MLFRSSVGLCKSCPIGRRFTKHERPMRKETLFAALFMTLAGSAASANGARFPGVHEPAAGQALLYIFRPELDRIRKGESPTLVIDGAAVVRLPHATYVELPLKPGQHVLQLAPGDRESEKWATQGQFSVEADHTYFVAVWNRDQPRSEEHTSELQSRVVSRMPSSA